MVRSARAPELTKAMIVEAALALADAHGVEAITMRQIAGVLGVSQMAAYRHFSTKDEIVQGLGEHAWHVLEAELNPALRWDEQLRRVFVHMHETHRQHPGLVEVLLARPVGGLPVYRTMERLVGTLRAAGFSFDESIQALASLESYTVGFTVHQRARAGRDPARDHRQLHELPSDDFPHLGVAASTFADWASEERFLAGLDWAINALRRDLCEHQR
jgi:AcrR family transcriptional regulator